MEFVERLVDSLNAAALKASDISVHTKDNHIGKITKASILREEVSVLLNNGQTIVF